MTGPTVCVATRWTGLVVGLAQMSLVGSVFACALFTNDLIVTTNMSLPRYGLFASLYLLGSGFFILTGPIIDHVGPRCLSVVAGVMGGAGHGALYVIFKVLPFPGFMMCLYIAVFISGVGLAGLCTVALWINLANFRARYHGTILGALVGMEYLGGSLFGILYLKAFSPHLAEYFLMMSLLCVLVNIVVAVFVRKVTLDSEYNVLEMSNATDSSDEAWSWTRRPGSKWILSSSSFYQLTLTFSCLFSGIHVVLYMYPTYLKDAGYGQYMTALGNASTYISSIILLIVGVLSDIFVSSFSRMSIFLLCSLMVFSVFTLAIFFIKKLFILILLPIAYGMGVVACDTLAYAQIHMDFGSEHFGRVSGLAMFVGVLGSTLLEYGVASLIQVQSAKLSNFTQQEASQPTVSYDFLLMSGILLFGICACISYLIK